MATQCYIPLSQSPHLLGWVGRLLGVSADPGASEQIHFPDESPLRANHPRGILWVFLKMAFVATEDRGIGVQGREDISPLSPREALPAEPREESRVTGCWSLARSCIGGSEF